MSVPQRRLDDRLRELCAIARTASDGDLEAVMQELLAVVHRKSERLRTRAAKLMLKGERLGPDRRAAISPSNTKI